MHIQGNKQTNQHICYCCSVQMGNLVTNVTNFDGVSFPGPPSCNCPRPGALLPGAALFIVPCWDQSRERAPVSGCVGVPFQPFVWPLYCCER